VVSCHLRADRCGGNDGEQRVGLLAHDALALRKDARQLLFVLLGWTDRVDVHLCDIDAAV
jgi:hypothetical protein